MDDKYRRHLITYVNALIFPQTISNGFPIFKLIYVLLLIIGDNQSYSNVVNESLMCEFAIEDKENAKEIVKELNDIIKPEHKEIINFLIKFIDDFKDMFELLKKQPELYFELKKAKDKSEEEFHKIFSAYQLLV